MSNEKITAAQATQPAPEKKKKAPRAPMSRTKKRTLAILITVAVVVVVLATMLIVRAVLSRRPPALEDIRARLENLIDASTDLNDLLWGEGLPVYPRAERASISVSRPAGKEAATIYYYTFVDAELGDMIAYEYYVIERQDDKTVITYDLEAEAKGQMVILPYGHAAHRFAVVESEPRTGESPVFVNEEEERYYYALSEYDLYFYKTTDDPDYEYVKESSGYLSTDDILEEVRAVFSAEVVAEIEEGVLTGVSVFEGDYGTSFPRYRDIEGTNGTYRLGKTDKDSWGSFNATRWVFDYSTMEMIRPSNAKAVTVRIECYPQGEESAREERELKFVLENGEWYLDSYTR